MKISLSVDSRNEIRFLRRQQDDATSSFANNRLIKEEVDTLCSTLDFLSTSGTIRCFRFPSLASKYTLKHSRRV